MIICSAPHVLPRRKNMASKTTFRKPTNCSRADCSSISMFEKELERHKETEAKLRRSVIREKALLRQKGELARQKDILSKESEHRLLNGLQLVTSLLAIQSRATKNAEAAAQLTIAANRVAAVGRVHRHLHTLDHADTVEFKEYLENLCHDLAGIASAENLENVLVVEGIELHIPATKGIPLGFIASELITNSIKYAKSRIAVGLERTAGNGYALSVTDDGPGLPEGFDPAASHGLGMKLISSLVKQIGGRLQIDRGDKGKGTRFSVLFS